MAPGTRPTQKSEFPIDRAEMEGTETPPNNDPWLTDTTQTQQEDDEGSEGFEDSFVVEGDEAEFGQADEEASSSRPYEQNKEYLSYLESKLARIERRKKRTQNITGKEVITSLRDVKERQMEWCFKQGISSSEDDTLDSDSGHSSGSGNSLTNELRRKMFPEQAINDTELLHLLEHDVIEKVLKQPEGPC